MAGQIWLLSVVTGSILGMLNDEAENVHVGLEIGSHVDMNVALAIL